MTHPTTPTVTQADRELLAVEYERDGYPAIAISFRNNEKSAAILGPSFRAIAAARQQERERVLASQMADRDSRPTRELAAIVDEAERDARYKAIGKALRLLRSRIPGGPADWREFDETLREIG